MRLRNWFVGALCLVAALSLPGKSQEKLLFRKTSAFGTILVTQDGYYRILKFHKKGVGDVEQSRCDARHPDYLTHEYSRLQLLGLLFPDKIEDVLVVGLGGGSLSKALAGLCPQARIDSVELDPVVAEAARRYFFYHEDQRVRTVIGDARTYLEKTARKYDLIFLDAFDGLEIPEPLRSRQFYRMVQARLQPNGAALANLHLTSHSYSSDRNTLAEVFSQQYSFLGTGLAMVVCQDTPERRSPEWIQARAQLWEGLIPYPLGKLACHYQGMGEWDASAPPFLSP